MTLISGIRSGLVSGMRSGLNPTAGGATGGGGATWSTDATSAIGTPATTAEWNAVIASAGLTGIVAPPGFLYLLQEPIASTTVADTVGGIGALTAGALPTFGATTAGWTRKSMRTVNGVLNQGVSKSPTTPLPDPLTTSYAMVTYARVNSTPALSRTLLCSTTGWNQIRITNTPRVQVIAGGGANVAGAASPTGQARPYWLITDVTGNATNGGTDAEKLTPVHADPPSSRGFGFGGYDEPAPDCDYLYAFGWLAANAEAVTPARLKLLLVALGWTVAW